MKDIQLNQFELSRIMHKMTILHDWLHHSSTNHFPYWANGDIKNGQKRSLVHSSMVGSHKEITTATMKRRTVIAIHILLKRSLPRTWLTTFLIWMRARQHLGPTDENYIYIPRVRGRTNLIFYVIQNFTLGFH